MRYVVFCFVLLVYSTGYANVEEEKADHGAEYVILYIWGDDHIRSLLRCRYMLTKGWNERTNRTEGVGKMFHGNFWAHVEINLENGKFEEKENLLPTRKSLYKMTDPEQSGRICLRQRKETDGRHIRPV